MKHLLLVGAVLTSAFSQEAKIMIVDREDSQKLAKSYREYQDARKHWEDAKADVSKRYTVQAGKTIEGWEKIQFSADFRAIVPESSEYARRTGCTTWSGATYAVPASSGTISSWPSAASSSLTVQGTASAPGSISAASGDLTIAVAPDGTLLINSDGVRPDVTVKEPRRP